jgi:hypothetical protein
LLARFATALSILLLSGCATVAPSIPPNYSGPQARLDDSAIVHSGSKADMFVAEQLDGQDIDNGMRRSQQASQGRGFALTTVQFGRPIVAGKSVVIGVKGRTVFAAPIQALTSTVYQVKGTVEFVPEANTSYVVRGEFGETYSAVWVEEAASRAVVGKKVEVKGSAKLGFLEK